MIYVGMATSDWEFSCEQIVMEETNGLDLVNLRLLFKLDLDRIWLKFGSYLNLDMIRFG